MKLCKELVSSLGIMGLNFVYSVLMLLFFDLSLNQGPMDVISTVVVVLASPFRQRVYQDFIFKQLEKVS